jgi:hypothetical protein
MMSVSGHKWNEKEKNGKPLLNTSFNQIRIINAELHASLSKSNYYNKRVK